MVPFTLTVIQLRRCCLVLAVLLFVCETWQSAKLFRQAKETYHEAMTNSIPFRSFFPNVGSCNYESGLGLFEPIGTWNWKTLDPERCPLFDYASLFSLFPTSLPKTWLKTPTAFLFIGDSLDQNIIMSICNNSTFMNNITYSTKIQHKNFRHKSFINHAPEPEKSVTIYGDKDRDLILAYFKIFGMHHTCQNGGSANSADSRQQFTLTKDRIRNLLPIDVLDYLKPDTQYHVLISSSLWDLSKGCNHKKGIKDYNETYREGIFEVYETIRTLLPNAFIGWRTSPPVSPSYNKYQKKKSHGRTMGNQKALNLVLKETVENNRLGIVVDWWAQVSGVKQDVLEKYIPDGRHYLNGPELSFFNMWINAVYDWNPHLLLHRS